MPVPPCSGHVPGMDVSEQPALFLDQLETSCDGEEVGRGAQRTWMGWYQGLISQRAEDLSPSENEDMNHQGLML